jgi:hypothetical protein
MPTANGVLHGTANPLPSISADENKKAALRRLCMIALVATGGVEPPTLGL